MTRMAVAGCMALAALGAVAVLDVGSRAAEAEPNVSPFAGHWSGTWAHVGEDVVGTWDDWTISNAGRITGRVYSITNNWGGAIVGHVRADGNLVMIAEAPGDVPADGDGAPFQGTVVFDGDGNLVVSATATWSGAISFVGILKRN